MRNPIKSRAISGLGHRSIATTCHYLNHRDAKSQLDPLTEKCCSEERRRGDEGPSLRTRQSFSDGRSCAGWVSNHVSNGPTGPYEEHIDQPM